MSELPHNFDLLATAENRIRQLSKNSIEASDDLFVHARMIEQAMNIVTATGSHSGGPVTRRGAIASLAP